MVDQELFIALAEFIFAAIAGLLAVYAWRNRDTPAGRPVFLLASAACAYAAVNGILTLTAGEPLAPVLGRIRGTLGAVIAASVFYTVAIYTNQRWFSRRSVLAALGAFLVVDAVAFLTNPVHQLVYRDVTTESGYLTTTAGPLWRLHTLVSFGLVVVALALLVWTFSTRRLYRQQTGTMILGIGVAAGLWAAGVFVSVHPAFGLSTVGIVFGCGALLWATTRASLLETVPVAREALMDSMDDYIIALDGDNRVIDINRSAATLLELDGDPVGRPATEVFSAVPELGAKLSDVDEAEGEFSLQHDGMTRYYQMRTTPITSGWSPLRNGDSAPVGQLVVIIDVTERRRRENELDLLKQVFARVLRHNLRNDLNVIKGNAVTLADRVPNSEASLAETVVESTDELLELSEKARDLEAIIESPRERARVDLAVAVEDATAEVGQRYPDAEIDVGVDSPCYVLAHRDLGLAIRNLVENSCEHDSDPPTTVEVTATAYDETVELVVEDDGPGLPTHEIEVLAAETETSLQHGSGLGLWIVNWLVNRSDASISIAADEDGTRVALVLDRAPMPDDHAVETPPEV